MNIDANISQADWAKRTVDLFKALGGPGSGNFGHAGRPGKVGGSAGRSDIGGPGESPATVSLAPPPGILEAIAKPDGGFTYSPTSGRQPKTGFALSIHKDREKVIDAKDATVGSLTAYARENIDLLRQTDNYMGGWHNPEDGKVYIDVSTVVDSAEEAERLGRENKQIAYFDLAKGESVTIQYDTGRGLSSARLSKEPNTIKRGESPTSEGNDDEKGRSPSRRVEDRHADARRIDRDVEAPDRPRSDARRNRRGQENPRATLAATLLRRLDALRTLGGPGSGNFGHAGRPGQVGGSATTSTLTSEEKIDLVKRRVTEVAEQLGVDPSTIHVVDKDPRDFEVGGQWFKEAGHYNPITEEIEINARNSYSPVMGVTYGIAAHEATHSLYHEARKRQDTEHKEIANLPPDGYNKYFRQSGYVRPEMQEEVHKRWPVSAMWYRHTGDSYMETEPDQGQGGQGSRFVEMVGRLEKEDGITEYSKAYWSPTALNKMYGTEMAINETLAEVARLRITGETSKVPAIWEQFYFDLRHTVITTRPRQ